MEQPFSTLKPVGKIKKAITKDINSEADHVGSSALGIFSLYTPWVLALCAQALNFGKYIKSQ